MTAGSFSFPIRYREHWERDADGLLWPFILPVPITPDIHPAETGELPREVKP